MALLNGNIPIYTVKAGSTSVILPVYMINSQGETVNAPTVGVPYVGGSGYNMVAVYYREGASAANTITLADGTHEWSSGGWYDLSNKHTYLRGFYFLGLPDAMIATGADWVLLSIFYYTDAGVLYTYFQCRIDLVAYDPWDSVRLGMTSLPNAIPGANNGLPTTNGTKINQTVDLTSGQKIGVSSLDANVITSTTINDGAITNTKVADDIDVNVKTITANAITATAINDGAITNAKVADDVDVNVKTITAGAITEVAFANDAISDAKVKSDVTIASITGNVGGTINGFTTAAKAEIQKEVADGLDAAIPAVPTTGSLNEVIKTNLDGKISDIDVSGITAAPTAVAVRQEMDANSTQMAAIRAKCNLFGTGIAQGISPMLAADRVVLVAGDDYNDTDSRACTWTEDGGWPTLAGTVTFEIKGVGSYACTYSGSAGSQVIKCALTAAQTVLMPDGDYSFNLLYIGTTGSRKISLVYDGKVKITKQVKYVAP